MEAILLALIASLPPTITALAALLVSMKTDKKTDEIRQNVNGNIRALTEELSKANAVVAELTSRMSAAKTALDAPEKTTVHNDSLSVS